VGWRCALRWLDAQRIKVTGAEPPTPTEGEDAKRRVRLTAALGGTELSGVCSGVRQYEFANQGQ